MGNGSRFLVLGELAGQVSGMNAIETEFAGCILKINYLLIFKNMLVYAVVYLYSSLSFYAC